MFFWVGLLKLLGTNARKRKTRTNKMTAVKALGWSMKAHIEIMDSQKEKKI